MYIQSCPSLLSNLCTCIAGLIYEYVYEAVPPTLTRQFCPSVVLVHTHFPTPFSVLFIYLAIAFSRCCSWRWLCNWRYLFIGWLLYNTTLTVAICICFHLDSGLYNNKNICSWSRETLSYTLNSNNAFSSLLLQRRKCRSIRTGISSPKGRAN